VYTLQTRHRIALWSPKFTISLLYFNRIQLCHKNCACLYWIFSNRTTDGFVHSPWFLSNLIFYLPIVIETDKFISFYYLCSDHIILSTTSLALCTYIAAFLSVTHQATITTNSFLIPIWITSDRLFVFMWPRREGLEKPEENNSAATKMERNS